MNEHERVEAVGYIKDGRTVWVDPWLHAPLRPYEEEVAELEDELAHALAPACTEGCDICDERLAIILGLQTELAYLKDHCYACADCGRTIDMNTDPIFVDGRCYRCLG